MIYSTDSNFRGKGGGGCGGLPKNKKNAMQEVAAHCASQPLGVGGRGGGVMFSVFQYGPKQEIETLVHEHEW